MAQRTKPVRISFGGLANKGQETALPNGALRIAHNGVIGRSGAFLSRPGYRVISAGVAHSLFQHPDVPFGLLYLDGNLCEVQGEVVAALQALSVQTRISYAFTGDRVVWSNGTDMGQVLLDGSTRALPLPTVAPPTVTAIATGGLPEGIYKVSIAPVTAWGERGPMSWPETVEVADGGGFVVGIPAPPAGALTVRLYVSMTGEDVLYAVTESLGIANYPVSLGVLGQGAPVDSVGTDPFEAAPLLAYCRRRLFAAAGNELRHSEILQYGVTRKGENVVPFTSDITYLDSINDGREGDGLYVGTLDGMFWLPYLSGTERAYEIPKASIGRGAIPGSSGFIPGHVLLPEGAAPSRRVPAWVDTDGALCIGRPGGSVQRIQAQSVAIPASGYVRVDYAVLREQETLVVNLENPAVFHPLAAKDTPVTTRNTYEVTHPA